MAKDEFIRKMGDELLEKLKNSPLFKERLLEDIKNGDVFPAIRNCYVDFYYKGGRLFVFDKHGFKTHKKYAVTPEDSLQNYVTEDHFNELASGTKSYVKDYKKIKENCKLYSGEEANGISSLYKYSYLRDEGIVLLDIEIALKSENEEKDTDRMDILLFDKKDAVLKFVEGKLYSNSEIRSNTYPEVVKQVGRYNVQIASKKASIIDAYSKYIEIVNWIFDLQLPLPLDIFPKTGFYIFGFDSYQRKLDLKENVIPKLNDQD